MELSWELSWEVDFAKCSRLLSSRAQTRRSTVARLISKLTLKPISDSPPATWRAPTQSARVDSPQNVLASEVTHVARTRQTLLPAHSRFARSPSPIYPRDAGTFRLFLGCTRFAWVTASFATARRAILKIATFRFQQSLHLRPITRDRRRSVDCWSLRVFESGR